MLKNAKAVTGRDFREPGLMETLKEGFLGKRRTLDCVQVEVSTRCPGHCTYCPRTVLGETWQSHDMIMKTFERLWPLMRISSRVHLQGWGEPLLNPNFFEMVALARRAGCLVSTTTCGLVMNDAAALQIVKSGIDIAAFSLTGTDETSNNAFRKGVDFTKVCDSISLLQEVRRSRQGVHLEIHFAYLLMASQLDAVTRLPELMRRLGVHAAVVSTLDYIPSPELRSEAITLEDTDLLMRAKAVLEEAKSEADKMGLGFFYSLPSRDAPGTTCHENINRSMFVSAQGDVSPCVYVNLPTEAEDSRRRVFGRVTDQDPVTIWNSESFQQFRERLGRGDPDPVCLSCPKRFMD